MYAELVISEASASWTTCCFASPNPGLSTRLTVHPEGTLSANNGISTFRTMAGGLISGYKLKLLYHYIIFLQVEHTHIITYFFIEFFKLFVNFIPSLHFISWHNSKFWTSLYINSCTLKDIIRISCYAHTHMQLHILHRWDDWVDQYRWSNELHDECHCHAVPLPLS